MDIYYISKLISLYISKEITREEEEILFEWVTESDSNKKFFQGFITSQDFQEYYISRKKINWGKAYIQFNSIRKSRNRFNLSSFAKYAAIFLVPVCLVSGLYLYNRNNSIPNEQTATIAPILIDNSNARITLTLADGKEVDVKKANIDSLAAKKAGINIGNNQIEYLGTHLQEVRYNTLSVSRGGQYKLKLADGTLVHLNSASELKYPLDFTGSERRVYLKGQALFEVTKSSDPFIVETQNIDVKVYGTKFDVNTNITGIEQVVLVEGSVGVTNHSDRKEIKLKPDQLAEFSSFLSNISITNVNVYKYIAWRDSVFIFEQESLEKIAKVLENSYDIDFVFLNQEARHLRYSGFMNKYEDFSIILNSFQKTLSAKFEYKNKKVIVR